MSAVQTRKSNVSNRWRTSMTVSADANMGSGSSGIGLSEGQHPRCIFRPSDNGDSPILPRLSVPDPPDEPTGPVTGAMTFDTRRFHTAILELGATAVILIRKNGRRWPEDCPTVYVFWPLNCVIGSSLFSVCAGVMVLFEVIAS